MKCGFPMAAQISFAHMFSLQLWNFQCSDEISFVSARLLWFMRYCQRKSFQIIPWIWIFISKTYLIEQNTWIWRMPGRLFTCFSGKVEKWKKQNATFETFPQQNQKTQCSTNLNLSPKKLPQQNVTRSFEKTPLRRPCVPRCESSWPFFRVWLPHCCSPWPQMVTVTLLQAAGNGANQQLGPRGFVCIDLFSWWNILWYFLCSNFPDVCKICSFIG